MGDSQVRDFVRSALYDPNHGYFSKRAGPVGVLDASIRFNQLEGGLLSPAPSLNSFRECIACGVVLCVFRQGTEGLFFVCLSVWHFNEQVGVWKLGLVILSWILNPFLIVRCGSVSCCVTVRHFVKDEQFLYFFHLKNDLM
jgi:hypothetical protein